METRQKWAYFWYRIAFASLLSVVRFLITATFRQLTQQGGTRGEFVTGDLTLHQWHCSSTELFKRENKRSSQNRDSQNVSPGKFEPETPRSSVQCSHHYANDCSCRRRKIFAIYLITILMCTVASPGPDPDHDPYPRDGGQLPNPNKCNSTLTSETREDALTPNPNECNSTLTNGISGGRQPPLIMRGQVSMMMKLPLPPPWFPDNVYFKNVDLRSLSQYGVWLLATTPGISIYAIRDIKSSVTWSLGSDSAGPRPGKCKIIWKKRFLK